MANEAAGEGLRLWRHPEPGLCICLFFSLTFYFTGAPRGDDQTKEKSAPFDHLLIGAGMGYATMQMSRLTWTGAKQRMLPIGILILKIGCSWQLMQQFVTKRPTYWCSAIYFRQRCHGNGSIPPSLSLHRWLSKLTWNKTKNIYIYIFFF